MADGKLLDYEDALALVLSRAPAVGDEVVDACDARGRVLRDDVKADRDQPPFDRSAMDGFAVCAGEVAGGKWFEIGGEVSAGAGDTRNIRFAHDAASGVVRIATGAVVPDAFDAVIPIEKARVDGERVAFEVDAVEAGACIHKQGADAKAGDVLVAAGTRLGAHHIGLACAAGAAKLRVARPMRVVVLTTGDEVMPPETATGDLAPQQIRNSNGPMLRALLQQWGAEVLEHVHVVDDLERTLCAAREAIARAQLVVTVGGVSVGRRDFLPMAWEQLGLERVLHGVAIQPGKPVFVATDDCKLVVGLPGNPVSVFTTAHLFVRPMLCGALPWRDVELGEPTKAKAARQMFRAGVLGEDGRAKVTAWQGSGDLAHLAGGAGFVRLPKVDGVVEAGTRVGWVDW